MIIFFAQVRLGNSYLIIISFAKIIISFAKKFVNENRVMTYYKV